MDASNHGLIEMPSQGVQQFGVGRFGEKLPMLGPKMTAVRRAWGFLPNFP